MRTPLHTLCSDYGQSPWLDNLKRGWLLGGELAGLVARGVRGVTSNPTIFQKAIAGTADYDAQWAQVRHAGHSLEDAYWDLVVADIVGALDLLRPVYDASEGADGFVSVEVDPALAHDTAGTVAAARSLHARIDRPNLFVKVPATAEGVPAVRQLTAEGISVNVTLIFSLQRYEQVIDAYLDGLEAAADPARLASVASFFVSRVDGAVDARLDLLDNPRAKALAGKAAIANAKLAYRQFQQRFAGPRWDALTARGARPQRPLWASTSTKNPAYPDTMYVDNLIGPDTVNTLPEQTLEAFIDHGTLARTVDVGVDEAEDTMASLAGVGIDIEEVTAALEAEGVASFAKSFQDLLVTLAAKS